MGRKKVDKKEKITVVKIWVKGKNVAKATKEVKLIEKKYNNEQL